MSGIRKINNTHNINKDTLHRIYTSCLDTRAILPKRYEDILSITRLFMLIAIATTAKFDARIRANTISQAKRFVCLNFSMLYAIIREYTSVVIKGGSLKISQIMTPVSDVCASVSEIRV